MTTIGLSAVSLIFGMSGAWLVAKYAYRLGLMDLPSARSSHTRPTPRGGGVGILAAFVLNAAVLQIPPEIWFPATLLALLSFFDDRLGLSPKMRFGFQFAAALIVVAIAGTGNENVVLSLSFIAFWPFFIVGTANFYNFMDGINGMAAITGVVGFFLIAYFSYLSGASPLPRHLSFALAMACLGFLPFNVPNAKVFMGDVGSVLLGFVFGVFVFWLTKNIADFLCLISLMFPFYADSLTTICIRWYDGEKLAKAHRRHLYQVLANEFGNTHWRVSIGYGMVQLLFGLSMIWTWRLGLMWQVLLFVLFSAAFIRYMFRFRNMAKRTT